MIARATSLYFAALTPSDCVRLLARVPGVLLRGARAAGPARARFERQWCGRTGAAAAVATPSARSGLYALLAALDIGAGDEVLITGFTCDAVPEPVVFRGARPVYVDIDARTYAMSAAAAAAAITPRTKLMIIQHTFGLPARTAELVGLARRHGLAVIEDCALALGSRVDGRWLGTAADASVWSFELSKTLTAGWGGLIQINGDAALADRVRAIRDQAGGLKRGAAARRLLQAGLSGLLYRPTVIRAGGYAVALLFRLGVFQPSATRGRGVGVPGDYLAAPDDRQWSVLERQLTRLDDVLDASLRAVARYNVVLAKHGCGGAWIGALCQHGVRLGRFPLQVRNRDRFTAAFAAAGIEVGRWFSRPVSCSASAAPEDYGYHAGDCPVAERASAHIVNLPLHARMSPADVETAAACLDRYLAEHADEREFVAAVPGAAA